MADWGATTGDTWRAVQATGGYGGDGWGTNEAQSGFQDGSAPAIQPMFGDGDDAPRDNSCRNCGQEGHFSRECPEPRKALGACFNCGQDGHSKADCPNPRVPTGPCRVCQKEGHFAKECPDRPPTICKNCGQEGHILMECTNDRLMTHETVESVDVGVAWDRILTANKERDLDDFKTAAFQYMKAEGSLEWNDFEVVLREAGLNYYLIAMEKELTATQIIVSFHGKLGMKYQVQFHASPKPRRARQAEGWPASPEENLERLKEAGEVIGSGKVQCSNCKELGHIAKNCTAEREEFDKVRITCVNCKEPGHRARDCKVPRQDPNACRNCKETGHQASDCPNPRSAEGVECKRCGNVGHFARDCPDTGERDTKCRNCQEEGHRANECTNPRVFICRNCDKPGHSARDCPEPKDWSKVKCNNCDQMGHTVRRCPEPIKEDHTNGDFASAPQHNGHTNGEATGDFEWGTAGQIEDTSAGGWNAAPTGQSGGW